jgi:hypothetical protein
LLEAAEKGRANDIITLVAEGANIECKDLVVLRLVRVMSLQRCMIELALMLALL